MSHAPAQIPDVSPELLRLLFAFGDALSEATDAEDMGRALHLLVPACADWCALDLAGGDGDAELSLTVAEDPELDALLGPLHGRHRREPDPATGIAAVLRTGEPELHADLDIAEHVPVTVDEAAELRRIGPRSGLVVPVGCGDHRFGALTWLSVAPGRRYDEEDVRRAGLFASRLAQAVGAVRTIRAAARATAERHADRSEQAAQLDAMYASTPVGLALFDAQLRYLRINGSLARMNAVPAEEHLGRTVGEVLGDRGEPVAALLRHVLATGEPVLGAELTGSAPDDPARTCAFSASFAPVTVSGRRLGVLASVVDITARHQAEAEAERQRALAHEQLALLDSIYGSSAVGLAFIDRDLRFARVNDALAETNGVPAARHLGRTVAEVVGEPMGTEQMALQRRVLETGEPLLDLDVSGTTPAQPGRRRHWLVSYTPVRVDDEVIGVLGSVVDVTAHREALDAREVALRRARFLNRTSELLDATLDVQAALNALADHAVPDIADWCLVRLAPHPDEPVELVAVAHDDAADRAAAIDIGRRWPLRPDGPSSEAIVLRTGTPLLVEEITDEDLDRFARSPEHRTLLARLDLRSLIVTPLSARGQRTGTITLFTTGERRLEALDLNLAVELGRRSGLAIDNARLLARHREIAHELQSRLLPAAIPAIPGAEVAVRYRAAGESNEVGGDFYDVVPVGEDAWVLLVADVIGKGASAAALTALLRHTLRAALREGAGLTGALERACEALAQEAPDRSCTVALCGLRREGDGFAARIALAGHLPPVLCEASGALRTVGALGTMLLPGLPLAVEEREVALAPGDLLLLMTDGAIDAAQPRPSWGEAQLRATVCEVARDGARAVVDAIERRAVAAADGSPRDDMALVAFAVSPRGSSGSAAGAAR